MKSRRELFEEQLRDLQKDISSLSNKLAAPPTATPSSSSNDLRRPRNGKSRHHTTTRLSNEEDLIAMLERSKEELRVMKKERDDAVYKSEQFGKEVEELRKEMTESLRLRTSYNYLKQDYESLKVSLESSERIRKQQKELVALLQRSHLVHGDTASTISFGSNASARDKPPPSADSQNRRAPDFYSQPTGEIGIAEARPQFQQQNYHQNYATAVANTTQLNSGSKVSAESRLRQSKKKHADSKPKSRRKSSPSSSQHDNLDIFLSAAPPSDLSSLVSAVSATQPQSSFSHDHAQAQYLQHGPFVPYYERSYPPSVQHRQSSDRRDDRHRIPPQLHLNDQHANSSKEVSFSRQLVAPSPNPKNQPVTSTFAADTTQPRSSSRRSRGITKAASSLTRRVSSSSQSSLPINAHYDAMHTLKGKPPRHPNAALHSAQEHRVHAVTPSDYNEANYMKEAPFFQQFEYTGKHPPLYTRLDADLTRSSSRTSPVRMRSSDPPRGVAPAHSGGGSSRASREITRPRSAPAAGSSRASSSRASSLSLSQSQRLSKS